MTQALLLIGDHRRIEELLGTWDDPNRSTG